MEHVLSLSYGKDSMACFGACEQLGWPIDRVVTADVWATDTIPADLPAMVEFKDKADRIIKERWGIEVEHIRHKLTYEQMFYRPISRGGRAGMVKGWPLSGNTKSWCKLLKMHDKLSPSGVISYVGIAADEPNRFHNLSETKRSPLVEAGWDEAHCFQWCEENDLLSPIYTEASRGGCWYCHYQSMKQLRLLRKNYPELWGLMLKWDKDSPVTFNSNGRTVRDYDKRFALEDIGVIPTNKTFRWKMLDDTNM